MRKFLEIAGVPTPGVALSASAQALLHHPDKGGDAAFFKQIARAYEVLGDGARLLRWRLSLPQPKRRIDQGVVTFGRKCFPARIWT